MFTLLSLSCNRKQTLFEKIDASYSNLDFTNTITSTPELNILNYLYFYNGAGVAAADFDLDGKTDLYFTANTSADKLFLNRGDFRFEDITTEAGIDNGSGWTTGVTVADVNHDGLPDIYVCKVSGYRNLSGHNLLYVNQGNNSKGFPVFKEMSAKYGLDFSGFSTQASFFDQDLDGDLDMYLLNHSVHPNQNYGRGSQRYMADALSGDRFYRNVDGVYIDDSENAGIYRGKIGYGLGVSVGDLNNDGYPDLYIGNDFFENDYLYLNDRRGGFVDGNADGRALGHTTHYSMGNTISDMNNDGLADIISLDMLPDDIENYKTSGVEFHYQIYQNYLKNGYLPQYMQNTLHLNQGNQRFSEAAYAAGIAASDWSWSPLAADFDLDGHQDLYITNGIPGATNDMDFVSFIANENIQRALAEETMGEKEMRFIDKIPEKRLKNKFFRNTGNGEFEDLSAQIGHDASYSQGAVYADLDSDGDLDIITNNINQQAFLLKNNSRELQPENGFIRIKIQGDSLNTHGIGTRVTLYNEEGIQTKENFPTNGYLSHQVSDLTFGLGKASTADSVTVKWPDGRTQTWKKIKAGSTLKADIKNADRNYSPASVPDETFLKAVKAAIAYKHEDQQTLMFNRDPLIPFANTNMGPSIGVSDLNNDGLDDVYIGGAKRQADQLYYQQPDGSFEAQNSSYFIENAMAETTGHIIFDANNDGWKDLVVVYGGNEFTGGKNLNPRLYLNRNGQLEEQENSFPELSLNASDVEATDLNNDGNIDLVFTADTEPGTFGTPTGQYVWMNDGEGRFTTHNDYSSSLSRIGQINDIVFKDLNNDKLPDAIICGNWSPVSIMINKGDGFDSLRAGLDETHGWWNTIVAEDFDNDGDIDLVAGNWGRNTRLNASPSEPVTLYRFDFNNNGRTEPLITHWLDGIETPFTSKDELMKNLPYLNKEFLSYREYARASLNELIGSEKLSQAEVQKVYTLESTYFENKGDNSFEIHPLPYPAQLSAVMTIITDDFNEDGFTDMFLAGNLFEISTQLGRLDANKGVLLLNDGNGFFSPTNSGFAIDGPVRDLDKIRIAGKEYFITGRNNDSLLIFTKNANKTHDVSKK
nr:VCBS repeat-containing protein [Robertkochia sp. 3YJGBD-33]